MPPLLVRRRSGDRPAECIAAHLPLDETRRSPEPAAVTTEAATNPQPALGNPDPGASPDPDGRMFCYRHPATETWLRCGRCDQPICNKCAVQGPVGSRCRQCGLVKNDPLTAFTPRQLALGTGVAIAGGAIAGFVGAYVGFFSIILGYFAGRFIADAVGRVVGYKRGPIMLAMLFGGILVGTVLGFAIEFGFSFGQFAGLAGSDLAFGMLLQAALPSVLISGGAACFGAYQRLP